MNKMLSTALIGATLLATTAAQATTYNFSRTVGSDGQISGYFQTDGTIGDLSRSQIVDFEIILQDNDVNGGLASVASSALNSPLYFAFEPGALFASATDLFFDFGSNGIFFTYTTSGDFWCLAGFGNGGCFVDNAEVLGYSDMTNHYAEQTGYAGVTSIASVASVPLPASLPLLVAAFGGIAVLGRRKTKKVS